MINMSRDDGVSRLLADLWESNSSIKIYLCSSTLLLSLVNRIIAKMDNCSAKPVCHIIGSRHEIKSKEIPLHNTTRINYPQPENAPSSIVALLLPLPTSLILVRPNKRTWWDAPVWNIGIEHKLYVYISVLRPLSLYTVVCALNSSTSIS